jgi:hypothetical protein
MQPSAGTLGVEVRLANLWLDAQRQGDGLPGGHGMPRLPGLLIGFLTQCLANRVDDGQDILPVGGLQINASWFPVGRQRRRSGERLAGDTPERRSGRAVRLRRKSQPATGPSLP